VSLCVFVRRFNEDAAGVLAASKVEAWGTRHGDVISVAASVNFFPHNF
jgi:hypothetical protein